MARSITCGSCDTALTVADSLAGKTIKCKACGEPVTVPASTVVKPPVARAATPVPAKPAVAKPVPAPPKVEAESEDVIPIEIEEDEPAPPPLAKRSRVPDDEPTPSKRSRPVREADEGDEDEDRPRAKRRPARVPEPEEEEEFIRTRPKPKSKLPLILGGLVGLLVIGGIAGAAFFLLRPDDTAKGTPTSAATKPSDTPKTAPDPDTPATAPTSKGTTPATAPTPPVKPIDKPPPPVNPPDKTPPDKTPPTPDKPAVKGDRLDPQALARVKAGTVYIEHDDGQGGGGSGSGWFGMEPGLIVTNSHVVGMKLAGSKEPYKLSVYLDSGVQGKQKKFEGQKVKVLAVDRDMDLAVLQIVNEKDLPPPLPIQPSTTLHELEKLVALGFPGGRRLAERNRSDAPPVVTVTETVVSAFRNDSAGNRYSIQLQGGVVHGNSGGPIIDTAGNVVGVAVRVDIGHNGQMTNIAYAVPAEYVTGLVAGRAVEAEVGQPYFKGDKVVYPVSVRCADAMRRLRSVGVGTWVGENSDAPRAPGDAHEEKPGDVGYREVPLTYDKDARAATGEVEFPRQADGRAYWVQPFYSNEVVAKRFTAGNAVKNTSPPVDRVSGMLQPGYKMGHERTLKVTQVAAFSERTEVNGKDVWRKDQIGQEIKIHEQVDRPTTPANYATLKMDLKELAVTFKQHDEEAELPKPIKEVTTGLSSWSSNVSVNKMGAATGSTTPNHTKGADAAKADLFKRLAAQLLQPVQGSLVPLPGKAVNAGDTWTAVATHRFVLDLDHVFQDRPLAKGESRGHVVREDVKYTYLGRRERNGLSELVVKVDGMLRPTGDDSAVCGSVTGLAVLDEKDGTVTDIELKREFDLDTSVPGTPKRAVGTETFKATREK